MHIQYENAHAQKHKERPIYEQSHSNEFFCFQNTIIMQMNAFHLPTANIDGRTTEMKHIAILSNSIIFRSKFIKYQCSRVWCDYYVANGDH